MLMITLREGDYFMVGGNVKVSYERSEGKDALILGVDAPKDVQILRGKYYENEIAKLAEAGDVKAQEIHKQLAEDYEKRRRKYNARRSSRSEQQRRVDAGEIKPSTVNTFTDVKNARRVRKIENDSNVSKNELKNTNQKNWGLVETDLSASNNNINVKYKKVSVM